MTPYRSVNYATWSLRGTVTLVALLNAGWVRVTTIEGGGAFPMTLEFFVVPDCYWIFADVLGGWRSVLEMYMVPLNLCLIGIAMAIPWARFGTATAAFTLLTVYLTFSSDPRFICDPIAYANQNIHGPSDISDFVGITLFDIISLVPRMLYLTLFFVTPVKWAPVGRWTRLARRQRVDAPLAT